MKHLIPSLLLASVALPAQGSPWKLMREKYDADGDGVIQLAEYDRDEETFARLDADQDGQLTKADFANRGEANVDMSDFAQRFWIELGKAADGDASGSVNPAEWKSFIAALEPDDSGMVRWSSLPFMQSKSMMMGMVRRMLDTDGDRELSTTDLTTLFGRLDHDEDGTLQRDELGTLPIVGDDAPDFELPFVEDTGNTVRLSSFRGTKPVGLIFGSYT